MSKNLSHIPVEKLDNMPKVEKTLERTRGHRRNKATFRRLGKWFNSKIGQNSDDVFSDYVNLKWLQKEYKTLEWYRRYVETNTFLKEDEHKYRRVFYYAHYPMRWKDWRGNEYESFEVPIYMLSRHSSDSLYVDPTSKKIQIAPKPPEQYSRHSEQTEFHLSGGVRLAKVKGVWYKIATSQLPSRDLKKLNLKNDRVDNGISRREYLNIR